MTEKYSPLEEFLHPIKELEKAGFVFHKDVMEPDFDYPLDFFERKSDGIRILGEWSEEARGIQIILNPYQYDYRWYVEDEDQIENFIKEFKERFEELAEICW